MSAASLQALYPQKYTPKLKSIEYSIYSDAKQSRAEPSKTRQDKTKWSYAQSSILLIINSVARTNGK